MVRKCLVCKKPWNKMINRSFHRFPKEPSRRKTWMQNVCVTENDLLQAKDALVCSDHFAEEDIYSNTKGQHFLNFNAVPKELVTTTACDDEKKEVVVNESTTVTPSEISVYNKNVSCSSLISISTAHSATSSDCQISTLSVKSSPEAVDLCEEIKREYSFSNSNHSDEMSIDNTLQYSPKCNGSTTNETENEIGETENEIGETENKISVTENGIDVVKDEIDPLIETEPNNIESDSSATLTSSETEEQYLYYTSKFRKRFAQISTHRKRRRHYVGDLTSDDFVCPEEAKENFKILRSTVYFQRKKIQGLHQTIRRLRARISSMQGLINILQQKS